MGALLLVGLLFATVAALHPRHFFLKDHERHVHSHSLFQRQRMGTVDSLATDWAEIKKRLENWETILPSQNQAFTSLAAMFGISQSYMKGELDAGRKTQKEYNSWWEQTFPFGYGQEGDHYFNAALYRARGPALKNALGVDNPYENWLYAFRADGDDATFRRPVLRLPDDHAAAAAKCVECVDDEGRYVFDSERNEDFFCWYEGGKAYREDRAVVIDKDISCFNQWPFSRDVNSIVMGDVNNFLIDLIGAIQADWDKAKTKSLLMDVMEFQVKRSIDQTAKHRYSTLLQFCVAPQYIEDVKRAVPAIDTKVANELQSKTVIGQGADYILQAKGIN